MNKRNLHHAISAVLCSSILLGCAGKQQSHVEQHLANELAFAESTQQSKLESTELSTLPESVSQTLMNPLQSNAGTTLIVEEKYDINARGVDAASFFAGLVKDTPYSVAIHPQISGNISLDLKQVTLDSIFALVSDLYGYHIEKNGTVYRVMPNGMRTETFAVNYLMMQRDGNTQVSIISGGVSQGGGNNQQNGGLNQQQNNFSSNSSNNGNGGNGFGNSSNGTSINTRSETNFW
jgi:MSHA biogenesis protein MshL